MSINENGTGQDRTIALADLPRFDDISAMFEEAQKEPDSKPLGMLQKLTLMTQKIGRRLRGDRTPSEYDTRRVDIPTFRGERYKTAHIKDGQLLSETTTDIQMRRSGSAILKNEVKVTNPFESGDLNRVSSRHSSLTIGQERDQILTEGVTLSNGVSFARTQDFQTGKTIFRKNDKGTFFEWTFDRKKRLISAYEGHFGEPDKPDTMRQTDYTYDPIGGLISATETRNTITPEGEKIEVIKHPVESARKQHISHIGGRG